MPPDAPFVQFTYDAMSPIPRSHAACAPKPPSASGCNFPPARVWVYRKD